MPDGSPPTPVSRRSGVLRKWSAALALTGLVALATHRFRVGERNDRVGAPESTPPVPATASPVAPPPAAPVRPHLRFPDANERAALLPLMAAYLDGESSESFKHRTVLNTALKRLDTSGVGILGDVEALKALIYAARPFLPNFEKKFIPKEAMGAEVVFHSGTGVLNVTKWLDLRFGISLPPAYRAALEAKKLNLLPPFPMIVTLHGKDDYDDAKRQKPFPGEEAIGRLYPKTSMKAVTDSWIIYAPAWPKGKWTEAEAVRKDRLTLPAIFRHFHVDFDRIVIEGGPEALLYAAAYPIYFGGCILRGDLSDVPADIVRNLDSTFVYVVETSGKVAPAYKTLEDGKHPIDKLAKGPPTGLPAWLKTVHRVLPKSFKWVVKDKSAHRFAYWMNLDVLDEATALPTIEAEIVDTKDDPNTVRITSTGVRGITVFLNDSLIDLDREIRVVINGKPLDECRIESAKPEGTAVRLPWKFDRTLDGMFDRRLISIRKSQMYCFIFPVALEQIVVPDSASPDALNARRADDAVMGAK